MSFRAKGIMILELCKPRTTILTNISIIDNTQFNVDTSFKLSFE